ncbi:MAG: TOMM precursor leader peptide-binding protein [Acidobacteriota bacterium]
MTAPGVLPAKRLLLKPPYRVEPLDRDSMIVLSERGHAALHGHIFTLVMPLLDGQRTADEIVDLLTDRAQVAEIYYALIRLRTSGYLIDVDGSVTLAQAAFWSALDLDPVAAQARVESSSVSLVSFGSPSVSALETLTDMLSRLGTRVVADGVFTIAIATDHLEPGLADLNAAALTSGRSWLLVKPFGTLPWIGPLFRPGHTGCWECLAHRLRANREVEAFLQHRAGGSTSPFPVARGALKASVGAALRLVTLEVARALGGAETQPTLGAVQTLDLQALDLRQHVLTRRPQCRCCGDTDVRATRAPLPLILNSRPKRFTADGGHRISPPEETLARFSHHVSPIVGVVSSLERVPSGAGFIQAYSSAHRTHGRRDTLFYLRRRLAGASSGKGIGETQAQASALCEALERWSLQFQGDEIRRTASYHELGADAIHPNVCLLISDAQYRRRDAWNARGSRYNRVPEPLDENARFDWSPIWSLTERRFKHLPTELIFAGYPDQADRPRHAYAESSGGAAGNTLEEAILQGFLELVERDGVSIWWYNRIRRPAVDLDSFDDPYLRDLGRHYQSLDREWWVLDLTTDLGVATFGAISRRVGRSGEAILRGFGAHFDPRTALLRAVTELNQNLALTGAAALAAGGQHPVDDPDALDWAQTATLADHPYLVPNDEPARTRDSFRYVPSSDLREDVLRGQSLVEERGLEFLVLDATRADIGLPVVKVVIPGLRPVWTRFAPGRLYDVPVRLGWLPRPLPEDGLNPQPYVP